MLETAVTFPQSERVSYPAPMPTAQPRRFLISPGADFWCFGGFSLLVAAGLYFSQMMRAGSPVIDLRLNQFAATFSFLALVCNYPHFMVSYKIAYGRGARFVLKNWYALLFVPIALCMLLTLAYIGFAVPVSSGGNAINTLHKGLSAVGLTITRSNAAVGGEVLSFMIWLMWLTVGWHYAKQVFGITLIQSRFENFQVSANDRFWLKAVVFSIAFESLIHSMRLDRPRGDYYGFNTTNYSVPVLFSKIVTAGFFVILAIAIYKLVFKRWRESRPLPSAAILIAPVSFLVWWSPPFRSLDLFYLATPFFHCLQYLPFAYVYEKNRASSRGLSSFRFTIGILLVFVAGFAFFEYLPNAADLSLNTQSLQTMNFFVIGAQVLINVHHYFIDSVIWKFDDPEVRSHVLGGVRA